MRTSTKVKVTASVVGVLLIAAGTTTGILVHNNQQAQAAQAHATALALCTTEAKKLTDAQAAFAELVTVSKTATSITSKQVADPATVTALADDVKFTYTGGKCAAGDTTDALNKTAASLQEGVAAYKTHTTALNDDVKAVTDSKTALADSTALKALKAEIATASALLSSSNGKTADNTARTALTTGIQTAQAQAQATGKHAADYTAQTTALKALEKAVNTAITAKTQADAQAQAQAQKQATQPQGNTQHTQPQTPSSSTPKPASGSGTPYWRVICIGTAPAVNGVATEGTGSIFVNKLVPYMPTATQMNNIGYAAATIANTGAYGFYCYSEYVGMQ